MELHLFQSALFWGFVQEGPVPVAIALVTILEGVCPFQTTAHHLGQFRSSRKTTSVLMGNVVLGHLVVVSLVFKDNHVFKLLFILIKEFMYH